MSAVAFASNGIAMRHRLAGDPAAAIAPATEALDIYTQAYVPAGMAQSFAILGFAAADLGNRDDADRFHRDGLEQALVTENPLILALALEGLAGVAILDDNGERAARLLGKADALRSTTASRPGGAGPHRRRSHHRRRDRDDRPRRVRGGLRRGRDRVRRSPYRLTHSRRSTPCVTGPKRSGLSRIRPDR